MKHDPLCPVYVELPENQCGYCHLISRVRADERERAVQRVEALNAERGYDMTSEFYSETGNDYAEGWVDLLGLVIAAIKGWYTHTSDDCPMRGQSDYVGCAICDKGDSDE